MPDRDRYKWLKLLPVIKAFTEGKGIQYREIDTNLWTDASTPQFGSTSEYRIKPKIVTKTVEVWATMSNTDGVMGVFKDEKEAIEWGLKCDQLCVKCTGTYEVEE